MRLGAPFGRVTDRSGCSFEGAMMMTMMIIIIIMIIRIIIRIIIIIIRKE